MHTFEICKDRVYPVSHYPGSWNELTKEQLLYLCSLLTRQLQPQSVIVRFLKYCLNMPGTSFFKIKPEVIAEMVEHLSFLLGQSRLTVNLLPTLAVQTQCIASPQLHSRQLNGPEPALQDLIFEQFFWHSEVYFSRFIKTNDEKFLNLLIATLYHEGYFDSNRITAISQAIAPQPSEIKHAILLFYQGCRGFLASKFPKVFSGSVSVSGKEDDLSPLRMLTALNNNDMTKNNEIKRTNLYEALVQMEENIMQSEKMKR